MSEPLLSVCLITYNHVKYIKEAIDGVLMQKVNFTWELIIADDFSIDGTREILIEYKKSYPDLIKLILQERNVGAAQNWIDLITAPRSKYIAYLEGDDYWTNPNKLQHQADFLEGNPEYALCFHDVLVIWEDNFSAPTYFCQNLGGESYYDIYDIIKAWFIPSASLLFRTNCIIPFPNWLREISNGDYAIQLLCGMHGKVRFISQEMAVYRRTIGMNSMTSRYNTMNNINGLINLFTFFNLHSNYAYHRSIRIRIFKLKIEKYILSQKFKYPQIWKLMKKMKLITSWS